MSANQTQCHDRVKLESAIMDLKTVCEIVYSLDPSDPNQEMSPELKYLFSLIRKHVQELEKAFYGPEEMESE